ncbi:hypothetical protein B0H14DRAFT_634912 [Mycena olivaceomarginata]|nr:hypothetical protein B0H14DRAFT_634912 [Mycena olivaceomarginata]
MPRRRSRAHLLSTLLSRPRQRSFACTCTHSSCSSVDSRWASGVTLALQHCRHPVTAPDVHSESLIVTWTVLHFVAAHSTPLPVYTHARPRSRVGSWRAQTSQSLPGGGGCGAFLSYNNSTRAMRREATSMCTSTSPTSSVGAGVPRQLYEPGRWWWWDSSPRDRHRRTSPCRETRPRRPAATSEPVDPPCGLHPAWRMRCDAREADGSVRTCVVPACPCFAR